MPPKLSKKKQEAMLAEAIARAELDAQKLFKQHERERRNADMIDRADLDAEIFVGVLEDERLEKEKELYAHIEEAVGEARARVFEDHEKHLRWDNISEASWLPSATSQAEINSFLSSWREQDYPNEFPHKEKSLVQAKLREDNKGTAPYREAGVTSELHMCEMARQLSENILIALDDALVRQDYPRASKLRESLRHVHLQTFASLDKISKEVVHNRRMFMDRETQFLTRWSPPEACLDGNPVDSQMSAMQVKFGLWVVPPTVKGATTTAGAHTQTRFLKFDSIGVSLDPTEEAVGAKAFRNATKDGAIRCLQLQYDPFSVYCNPKAGQKYYALNCILIVESLLANTNTPVTDEYAMREDKPAFHEPIPDKLMKFEEPIKVTFRAPEQVVLRHPGDPLIGVWDDARLMWRPLGEHEVRCSVRSAGSLVFKTNVVSKMAIIQEKAFDIPYASWNLFPIADDQVLFVIEGRDDRGERQADRMIRILVREHECRLFGPDKPELAPLRDNWVSPATLLRRLAKAGYNFLLTNKDAEVANKDVDYDGEEGYDDADMINPKSAELELRAYSDMATFCTAYAFANSSHNSKIQVVKENESLALFRISRVRREEGGPTLDVDMEKDSQWYGVRYEHDRCVLGAFNDSDQEPDLSSMPGKLTHLNLHMLLRAELENDMLVDGIAEYSSHLLQNSVFQLLMLTRPLSWG